METPGTNRVPNLLSKIGLRSSSTTPNPAGATAGSHASGGEHCERYTAPADRGEGNPDRCLVSAVLVCFWVEGEQPEGVGVSPCTYCQWPGNVAGEVRHCGANKRGEGAEGDEIQVPLAEPGNGADPELADLLAVGDRQSVGHPVRAPTAISVTPERTRISLV